MAGMEEVINSAIEACGSLTSLAARLSVEPQVVVNWRTRGVPVTQCSALEAACDLAVRRWDMRPDDWHRIWPELIGTEGAPPVSTQEAA
jgi:DNA-binding transcriptional regulator YdaS (Cro superfamily)